ncbi:MAG: helix-turn-helix transcriptional regulator [Bacilli bacterium]|nr:helix-turn-helix transcriptional regulator [Bacilli bacterium]
MKERSNKEQEKLANEINTNKSVICSYEKGKRIIPTPFLYEICKKYNISADYLLGKIDSPKFLK